MVCETGRHSTTGISFCSFVEVFEGYGKDVPSQRFPVTLFYPANFLLIAKYFVGQQNAIVGLLRPVVLCKPKAPLHRFRKHAGGAGGSHEDFL